MFLDNQQIILRTTHTTPINTIFSLLYYIATRITCRFSQVTCGLIEI